MKTYKITASTNGYIAKGDSMFNGCTEVTLSSKLTLKEAYTELLAIFNRKHDLSAPNWGIAVRLTRDLCFGAVPTFSDGTRAFEWDGRTFRIEEEETEE